MTRGRPSKYDEAYCQQIIEHCKTGLSRESFAAVIDVNKDTLYEWRDKYPDFSEAWARCRMYRQRALEELVMKHATGKSKGSTAAALFMLKNIAPEMYKDRTEVVQVSADKMTVEELRAEAEALLRNLGEN